MATTIKSYVTDNTKLRRNIIIHMKKQKQKVLHREFWDLGIA